jgi:hypothetical protein
MAAFYGGTTTLADFAHISSAGPIEDGIAVRDAQFEGKAACGWAYHLMLQADPADKIFTTHIVPHRKDRMVDLGDMWEVFKALASNFKLDSERTINLS